jgi:hypothetical protein
MIHKLFGLFVICSSGLDAVHLRGPSQEKESDECDGERELPGAAALRNHPIGPHFLDARKQLDRLGNEMAKLGTGDTPNFDAARHRAYAQALGPST